MAKIYSDGPESDFFEDNFVDDYEYEEAFQEEYESDPFEDDLFWDFDYEGPLFD